MQAAQHHPTQHRLSTKKSPEHKTSRSCFKLRLTRSLAQTNTTLKKQRDTSSAPSVDPISTKGPMRRHKTTSTVHAWTKPTRTSMKATTSGKKGNGSAAPPVASSGTSTAKRGSSAPQASTKKERDSKAHHHSSTSSNRRAQHVSHPEHYRCSQGGTSQRREQHRRHTAKAALPHIARHARA